MRSGLPSPLTSATATDAGCGAGGEGLLGGEAEGVVAPGAVVFSSTDTVLEP